MVAIEIMNKLGPYELNTIITGDARELAKAIPDESIDLIFTDPVYNHIEDYKWLAETAARVLKSNGSVLAFCGNANTLSAGAAMLNCGLREGPILEHLHLSYGAVYRLFSHSLQVNLMPCLWFSKGIPNNKWMYLQHENYLNGVLKFHKWGKNTQSVFYRIEKFTEAGTIIFDPFTGGGTVPAVCKMLNRQYLAFEIDPETADLARERVRLTQPPLPIEMPEQLSFEVVA